MKENIDILLNIGSFDNNAISGGLYVLCNPFSPFSIEGPDIEKDSPEPPPPPLVLNHWHIVTNTISSLGTLSRATSVFTQFFSQFSAVSCSRKGLDWVCLVSLHETCVLIRVDPRVPSSTFYRQKTGKFVALIFLLHDPSKIVTLSLPFFFPKAVNVYSICICWGAWNGRCK